MSSPPSRYDSLARRLEWRRSADAQGRYLNVFLEQNNTCNLRCRMCGFSEERVRSLPRNHMPRWLFDDIARQVFPLTTYLHMSLMTEPFMTPDFTERLQLVREYGVPYSLVVTNGTLLTADSIGKILDAQITSLAFSIDGGTKAVYEDIRTGARFETVLRNLDLFREMREARGVAHPRLRINHVLMDRNLDHFDEFLGLLAAVHPEEVDVRIIQPTSFTIGAECMDPQFFAKVRRIRPRFTAFCAAHGIDDCGFIRDQADRIEPLDLAGVPMTCRRPWDTLAIHANGDVLPCTTWTRPPLGNFATQTFEEIWYGDVAESLRDEFDRAKPGVDCQHCTIKQEASCDGYDDFFFKLVSKEPVPRFLGSSSSPDVTPPKPEEPEELRGTRGTEP